jgi:hypothetical protein
VGWLRRDETGSAPPRGTGWRVAMTRCAGLGWVADDLEGANCRARRKAAGGLRSCVLGREPEEGECGGRQWEVLRAGMERVLAMANATVLKKGDI